jgi:hypothetical protein
MAVQALVTDPSVAAWVTHAHAGATKRVAALVEAVVTAAQEAA